MELLEETGLVPSELREEILAETDGGVLKKWLKLASRAENIDEFIKRKSE